MKLRSRVFISCGQNAQTDEYDIALRIGQLLDSLGYDPYVAVAEKSLRGLKENLFARLSESEYYLFIDFKREPISKDECRGSLFSHQELAIAAFLDMPVLAFQEKGVRRLDGLIAFLQTNSSEFSDRDKLLTQIATEVSSRWQPNWRNQLRITRDASQFADAIHGGYQQFPQGRPVRYFQLGSGCIEKNMMHKLTRISYNSAHWQKPKGEARELEAPHTYNRAFGFGNEDWLFRSEWLIDGWRYAFLQGVNKGRQKLVKAGQPSTLRYLPFSPTQSVFLSLQFTPSNA